MWPFKRKTKPKWWEKDHGSMVEYRTRPDDRYGYRAPATAVHVTEQMRQDSIPRVNAMMAKLNADRLKALNVPPPPTRAELRQRRARDRAEPTDAQKILIDYGKRMVAMQMKANSDALAQDRADQAMATILNGGEDAP